MNKKEGEKNHKVNKILEVYKENLGISKRTKKDTKIEKTKKQMYQKKSL